MAARTFLSVARAAGGCRDKYSATEAMAGVGTLDSFMSCAEPALSERLRRIAGKELDDLPSRRSGADQPALLVKLDEHAVVRTRRTRRHLHGRVDDAWLVAQDGDVLTSAARPLARRH